MDKEKFLALAVFQAVSLFLDGSGGSHSLSIFILNMFLNLFVALTNFSILVHIKVHCSEETISGIFFWFGFCFGFMVYGNIKLCILRNAPWLYSGHILVMLFIIVFL